MRGHAGADHQAPPSAGHFASGNPRHARGESAQGTEMDFQFVRRGAPKVGPPPEVIHPRHLLVPALERARQLVPGGRGAHRISAKGLKSDCGGIAGTSRYQAGQFACGSH